MLGSTINIQSLQRFVELSFLSICACCGRRGNAYIKTSGLMYSPNDPKAQTGEKQQSRGFHDFNDL